MEDRSDHIPVTRMLVPKAIHPNQTIESVCEALNYLDSAINNEHAITLLGSAMRSERLPKALYVYARHLQLLDRVLHLMEKHLRDLYSSQVMKKKHEAVYQLYDALQDQYLKILAHSVLERSQELCECLIDDKSDKEILRKLCICLNKTRDAAELLIKLLRDCLEKENDNEEISQKLNNYLTKAETAREILWYPNRYLKKIGNRFTYECLNKINDFGALLLELQFKGRRSFRRIDLRDSLLRPQYDPWSPQYNDFWECHHENRRRYGYRYHRSRKLNPQRLNQCLQKATEATEMIFDLWLRLQYNNKTDETSQKLFQCYGKANDIKEILLELRLKNDKDGNEISQKLCECYGKAGNTRDMLRGVFTNLKNNEYSEETEDVLGISLRKAHNGRKILQEMHRCFEQEKDSKNVLQELYKCREEDEQGEEDEKILRTLNKCLKKTKHAGGTLLEVLRDYYSSKQDARFMLPELLHDDHRQHRRGWKISQKPDSQNSNQELEEYFETIKDAGGILPELFEYLANYDGGVEDYVNNLLSKILVASITCSPDEDVKVLRDVFIRINLLKPSREGKPGKLSATMTTGSDSFVESSCAIAGLLFNSNSIDTNCRISRPFRDRLHHGDPQVCSVYRLGCKKHFCALPTGHTRLHEFSGPCNAYCNLNWDFSTDYRLPGLFPQRLNRERLKVSSTYQLGCREDRCTLPLGHTSPHKFLSRCSAGCILSSDHSGAHLFPHTLSTDANRMHKKAMKMKAAAMHLVDRAICTSLLNQGTTSATLPGALASQSSDQEEKAIVDEAARSGEMSDLSLEKDAVFVATRHIDRLLAQDGDQFPPQKDLYAVNTARTKAITGSYSHLDTSKKQIRLFELYPSTNASEIKGSFHCVELSAREYTALSYTWGNETPCREIQVNGEKMSIRENLWWFLGLQSNSISEPKFFWIDAICINQSNVEERNHQVGFMSQIYTNASAVYVWLGRESDDSDSAMEYITRQASKELKTKGMRYRPLWSKQEGRALVELCERPYWRRIWIIQEVISARNIIAFCGTKRFDWACLMKLYHKLKILESTNWLTHHAFALAVFQSSASVIIWQRAYWRHPIIPTPSLKKLISVFSGWQCTDLRDKVYALVGMASPETTVVPDYSRTTYQICQDIWAQDAHEDSQYYDMLIQVLELSRDP